MNIHQPRTTRLTNTCHAGTGPTTALKTCKYNLPIWTVLCLLPSHLSKRTRPPSLEGEKKPLPPKNLSLPKILSTIALPAKFGEPCPLSSALLLRMPPKPFPTNGRAAHRHGAPAGHPPPPDPFRWDQRRGGLGKRRPARGTGGAAVAAVLFQTFRDAGRRSEAPLAPP